LITEAEVYARLTGIFREFFDDQTIMLSATTSPRDIEGWDSAKMVNILLGMEEVFEFELDSSEIDGLRCIGDFVAVILSRDALT
jgi:acyl carrier protein